MGDQSYTPARVNFIYGEEDYRREEEISKVSSFVALSEGADQVSKDASDDGGQSAVAEAMMGSLFAQARHIIIRRCEELKAADAKELIAKLTDGKACPLPDGTYVSVSWADRKFPPAGAKIPKAASWVGLKECKKVYERDAKEFIRAYASEKGLALTTDGVEALVLRLGTDLSLISSEVEKLITYMGKGKARVTGEDVRKAIGEATHEGLSDLTTAIITGGSSHALHLVRQFRESAEPRIPNQLMLAAIASELRLMLSIQRKLASGTNVVDTVKETKAERQLRTPDFILERTVNLSRRLGPAKASRMLVRLGEADRQMKGGTALSDTVIGEDQAFESAVIDLCAISSGR